MQPDSAVTIGKVNEMGDTDRPAIALRQIMDANGNKAFALMFEGINDADRQTSLTAISVKQATIISNQTAILARLDNLIALQTQTNALLTGLGGVL